MTALFPGLEEISEPEELQGLEPRLNWTHNVGPLKTVADLVPGTHDHYAAVAPIDSECGNFDHTTLETLGRALETSLMAAGRSTACVYHVWSGVLPPEVSRIESRAGSGVLESSDDLLLRGTVSQLGELRRPLGHGFWSQLAPTTLLAERLTIATNTDVSELFIGSDLQLLPALREAGLQVREVSSTTVPTFCR